MAFRGAPCSWPWADTGAGGFIVLLVLSACKGTWWRVKIPLCSFRVSILNLALKWVLSFSVVVQTKQVCFVFLLLFQPQDEIEVEDGFKQYDGKPLLVFSKHNSKT